MPPAENLEHIDVELIDSAQREIDLAAYVLTDWPVIQALTRVAGRGVHGNRRLSRGYWVAVAPH
jgi:phosphatidylserine/phosphatidylglycerophosphate/cardiolipin synthase-like enzyme